MAKTAKMTKYCISNSQFEDDVYRETYWPKTEILRFGHARNDVFFELGEKHKQEWLNEIKEEFNIEAEDPHFVLYAPTFTANRIKLAEFGMEERLVDINRRMVALSREAAGGRAYVAGDLTMTGRQLKPMGTMEFEELVDVYREQVRFLENAGVDLLVAEAAGDGDHAR